MTKTLKISVLAVSALAALTTVSAAQAQSFGGLPTVTPQAQADRARRAADSDRGRDTVRQERPSYVVVDKGGPGGGQQRQSYDTIQSAVDAVAWGGVVVVMPGIYEENVVLSRSVSLQGDRGAGAGVEIIPASGEAPCLSFLPTHFNDHAMVSNITFRPGARLSKQTASINGDINASVNGSMDAKPCVDVTGGIFTMVESTVDGAGAHRGDLVHISGGTATLEKNQFTGGRRGISVSQNHALWDRALLIDNIVSNNLVEGVHLEGVSSMLATGNLINANGRGLVYNGRGAATLVGNKILNNQSHGLLLDQDAHQVLVRLNQIWSNKGDGIKVFSSGGLIEDNDIDGNMGAEISTVGHLDTVPTIINDVAANKRSPKRGGWAINQPRAN
ncbi:right-handed parallel beta-helix repeat-containing protein [Parvularcula sp. LCG005]|uniref:right-handed parallel beta-helix repeat-containing protein n=1 Tax=Parvularcula sp. LCG005 TaxID=3078805 RepID=UPI0029424EDC|nr:right-handed parallel beta-helix repeat-containing protein [Parvularcula sp. LCG005]WOI52012.1 right-handed parallel beta-helix repeat-containing protein [Parvularcula sp. LCG005]